MGEDSENITLATSSEWRFSNTNWTIFLIANILITILQIWIGAGFIVYALRSAKRKSRLSGGIILKSALIAVIVPVARYAATFSIIMVSGNSENDLACEVAIDFGKSAFIVAVFFIGLFFWVRQRAFYGHPSLGHSFGKCAGYMSKITIGLFILLLLVTLPLSVFPSEYEASKRGCIFKNGEKQYGFRDYLYAGIMLVSQGILLGLFLHPLWIHHASQKKSNIQPEGRKIHSHSTDGIHATNIYTIDGEKVENPSPITSHMCSPSLPSTFGSMVAFSRRITRTFSSAVFKKARAQAAVFRLMKRTFYLAVVAVVTDLVVLVIVGVVLPPNTPQIITRLVYDADLLINSATILLSFKDWIRILLPFRGSFLDDLESQSSVSDIRGERLPRQGELNSSKDDILRRKSNDTIIVV